MKNLRILFSAIFIASLFLGITSCKDSNLAFMQKKLEENTVTHDYEVREWREWGDSMHLAVLSDIGNELSRVLETTDDSSFYQQLGYDPQTGSLAHDGDNYVATASRRFYWSEYGRNTYSRFIYHTRHSAFYRDGIFLDEDGDEMNVSVEDIRKEINNILIKFLLESYLNHEIYNFDDLYSVVIMQGVLSNEKSRQEFRQQLKNYPKEDLYPLDYFDKIMAMEI